MTSQKKINHIIYVIINVLMLYGWLALLILLLFGENGIDDSAFLEAIFLPASLVMDLGLYPLVTAHLLIDVILVIMIMNRRKRGLSPSWDKLVLYIIKVKYGTVLLGLMLLFGIALIWQPPNF